MALSTLSTVYTYYDTYTGTTAYDSKNSAAKAWIEDMAAASIAGLTYYDKVSPDVSTSAAQTFSVTFETSDGYYIKFQITTTTAAGNNLYVLFLGEDGESSGGGGAFGVISRYSSGFVTTMGMTLIRYFDIDNYDIYAVSVAETSTTYYPFGALYLEHKASTAPNYAVVIPATPNNIYNATTNTQLTTRNAGEPDDTTGACAMFDAPCFYNNKFIATFKNTKCIGAKAAASPLSTYMVGGDTYIAVSNSQIYVHVT